MATTVTAPVGNTMVKAQKYLPLLDETYVSESKTAILDTASEFVNFTGAGTVQIYSIDTVGMANYDRNAGYVPGDVDGAWQSYTLETDRGRSYQLDTLDNEESMGLPIANLLGNVERHHIIPEVDAYRFAQYATNALAAHKVTGTYATGAAAVAAIDTATAALDNTEVPYEDRILFVTPDMYALIKAGVTRMVMNRDDNVNYNVAMYNDMRLITVPQKRFYTGITLNNSTTAAGVGGYTNSGNAINFMIVHPSAIMQVMKYYAPRVFSPNQNPQADAWLVQPRFEHGAWVRSKRTNGIYVSSKSST